MSFGLRLRCWKVIRWVGPSPFIQCTVVDGANIAPGREVDEDTSCYSSEYDKCMKRFKLQDLMSQNKSQLISFILYKPLQVTLSRNTYQLNVGKVPKRKRSHINSIKQMNVDAIAPPADPRIVSHPHMYFRFTHKILAFAYRVSQKNLV